MIILLRRIAIFIVMVSMFIMPLMAGGNLFGEYVAYVNWGLFAGLLLFFLTLFADNEKLDLKPVSVWPWVLVYLVVSGWILLQLFVFPSLVGNVYGHEPLISPFQEGVGVDVGPVGWYQSILYWGFFTTFWAIGFFAFSLNRQEGRWFLFFLALAALFQLFYGLFFSKSPGTILGLWEKTRFAGSITGTYVHPNHFTGFLVMMMPVSVAGILYFFSNTKQKLVKGFGYVASILLVLISASVILGSSVRLSMAACAIGWFVFFWYLLKYKFKTGFILRTIIVLGVGGGALLLYAVENMQYISNQFAQLNNVEGRFGLWQNILNLPTYVWLWGGGAGVFGDIYVLSGQRVLGTTRAFEEAHNDYLQFLVEFGVIGAALSVIAVIIWLYKLWPSEMPYIKIGALAGISGMLFRLGADFDLQLPGTAVFFWALCGVFLNPNLLDRQRKRKKSSQHRAKDALMEQALSDVYEDAK